MGVTIDIEGLSDIMSQLSPLLSTVTVGVASIGDPSQYALVLEFGFSNAQQPGPRTVIGINGVGEAAIMSSQAPTGYIRVNQEKYLAIVKEQIADVDWSDIENLHGSIEDAMNRAGEEITELIYNTAPVDTGALIFSFGVIEVGDPLLTTQDSAVLG